MNTSTQNICYQTKSMEIDDVNKGVVTIAVNAFNNQDADGDISANGSFANTLKNDFNRSRWFLNHNKNILLGLPLSGYESDTHLVMKAKFNLDKEIGRDTYSDYKLYQEGGRTLEHSIGVIPVKRNSSNKSIVEEWKLLEFSTLTSWGANPDTYLIDIKQLKENPKDVLNWLIKSMGYDYSDARLNQLDHNKTMIEKAINGELIVQCPCCKAVFNYSDYNEQTIENEVIENAISYAHWIAQDVVRQRMEELTPVIRDQVEMLIQNKSFDFSNPDSFSYVRCPKCYSKVTKNSAFNLVQEDVQTKSIDYKYASTKLDNILNKLKK